MPKLDITWTSLVVVGLIVLMGGLGTFVDKNASPIPFALGLWVAFVVSWLMLPHVMREQEARTQALRAKAQEADAHVDILA